MSKQFRDSRITQPASDDLSLDSVTDLFAPQPSAPATPKAALESLPYTTDEMQIAVALIVNGYGEPDVREVGSTKTGAAKVEFVFALRPGETPRSVEDGFWRKKFSGEVSQIFAVTRNLKKRISRLTRALTESAPTPAAI